MVQDDIVIDKQSVIPIYYQLFKYFEKRIRSGDYKPGDALPTEIEIAERFGISRMTVRRAIAELANLGMVYTQKGKGTFVAKPNWITSSSISITFTMKSGKRGSTAGPSSWRQE